MVTIWENQDSCNKLTGKTLYHIGHRLVWFMVFNTTFSNITVISWRSILLVEETGVPGENHQPVKVTDKLYHIRNYETAAKISCIICAGLSLCLVYDNKIFSN
jgi:hypothetical protein